MTSRFRVVGKLDTSVPAPGLVLIDRNAGLFSVRPYRRRRLYTLPLSTVAEIVCSRIIKAEIAAKRARRGK
jgi:hypothetical protein